MKTRTLNTGPKNFKTMMESTKAATADKTVGALTRDKTVKLIGQATKEYQLRSV
jgi:hypothetical protein